jgi:DNA repair protein RadD
LDKYPQKRIAVIAHRQELITQARDKLLNVWPEATRHIGLACSGVGEVDVDKPVVIGSVQTLDRRKLTPFDFLIVDECHHIPPLEDPSQYHNILKWNLDNNPSLRIFGVTATPFRLGHGYIYGSNCKPGKTNLFPRLDYSISMKTLVDQRYLVQWRAKRAVDMQQELNGVKKSRGDYDIGALSSLMSKDIHIQSAVNAYEDYGEERQKVVVFAVTIEHAKLLEEAFKEKGYSAVAVHSLLNSETRRASLYNFEKKDIQFLINVGILTEGWDSPIVDEIIMCRPTMSPGLFVQMVGRGMRVYPDKNNLLVLDLAGNFERHGDPARPNVYVGKESSGEAVLKCCPECFEMAYAAQKRCLNCGYQFYDNDIAERESKVERPVLIEVGNKNISSEQEVLDWGMYEHLSLKGNKMICLWLKISDYRYPIKSYLDIAGTCGFDYPLSKARRLWRLLNGNVNEPPRSIYEALVRKAELHIPQIVHLFKDKNDFVKVKEFEV